MVVAASVYHNITIATPTMMTAPADDHATAYIACAVKMYAVQKIPCISHYPVHCRCNTRKEECVCGFVQPQQTPDLGPPAATPSQLYLHQEHCLSEFPAQAVNQSI